MSEHTFPWRPDGEQILDRLRREHITALYHFTSVENLAEIRRQHALCSKEILEERGAWPVPQPGGNPKSWHLDRRHGNWSKVCLSFTPHLPMAWYRKNELHLCYLLISPEVAAEERVVFTDTNATAENHRRGTGIEALDLVNFNAVRGERSVPFEQRKRGMQAEVLVPYLIPLSQIREIAFVSAASREEGRRLWGPDDRRIFTVAPEHFVDNGSDNPAFAYVESVLLFEHDADASPIVPQLRADSIFPFRTDGCIAATGTVHTAGDTQLDICWSNGRHRSTMLTRRPTRVITDRVPMCELRDGLNAVEFWLNGIRWARREFTLEGGYAF